MADSRSLEEIARDPHTCWFCGGEANQCKIYEFKDSQVRPTSPWSYKTVTKTYHIKVNVCENCATPNTITIPKISLPKWVDYGIVVLPIIIIYSLFLFFRIKNGTIDLFAIIGGLIMAIGLGFTIGVSLWNGIDKLIDRKFSTKIQIKEPREQIRSIYEHPEYVMLRKKRLI